MCLCGSKKIIKINPFKKTKNHNQQATKLYVPMWFKKNHKNQPFQKNKKP